MLPTIIIAQSIMIWELNSNYTKQAYDIFNIKISYFFDICYIVAIKQLQFHVVLRSIMSS